LGWTEGRNLRIDIRAGAGNAVATRKYAAELVALGPDVILGTGASPAALLVEASHTVPIVFTIVVDPIAPDLWRSFRGLAETQPALCSLITV
jgi:putative ABC transport system substrate-binding protein